MVHCLLLPPYNQIMLDSHSMSCKLIGFRIWPEINYQYLFASCVSTMMGRFPLIASHGCLKYNTVLPAVDHDCWCILWAFYVKLCGSIWDRSASQATNTQAPSSLCRMAPDHIGSQICADLDSWVQYGPCMRSFPLRRLMNLLWFDQALWSIEIGPSSDFYGHVSRWHRAVCSHETEISEIWEWVRFQCVHSPFGWSTSSSL